MAYGSTATGLLDPTDEAFQSPPVPPIKRVKKFRPEVEKQRAKALRDFGSDDAVEEYLQELDDEYTAADERKAASKAKLVDRTLGEDSPERRSYQGASLLGRVRTERAGEGRTSITGSEAAGTIASAAGYTAGGLPGLALQYGVEQGVKKVGLGDISATRSKDSSGKVRKLGLIDAAANVAPDVAAVAAKPVAKLALKTPVGKAVAKAAEPVVSSAAKKIGSARARTKVVGNTIRDWLKTANADETGNFRLPGSQVDDVPDDVAKLAFGDAADDITEPVGQGSIKRLEQMKPGDEISLGGKKIKRTGMQWLVYGDNDRVTPISDAGSVFDSLTGPKDKLIPDVSQSDYARRYRQGESTLGHLDDDTVRRMYTSARKDAAVAQDMLDRVDPGSTEELGARKSLMEALDRARKNGDELYNRTNGQEGMGNKLKNFVGRFLSDETGAARIPGKGREDPLSAIELHHGTQDQTLDLSKIESRGGRVGGISFTPNKDVAAAYAGDKGKVLSARLKPGAKVIDATGTAEKEDWHYLTKSEWDKIQQIQKRHGVDLLENAGYGPSSELKGMPTWEALTDAGAGGFGGSPETAAIFREAGYDGINTFDQAVGISGDLSSRGLKGSFDAPEGRVPVTFVYNKDVLDEPLSGLEQQLKRSQELLAGDKDAALNMFKGNSQWEAGRMAAESADKSASFRLKRRAGKIGQAFDDLKGILQKANDDETGAFRVPGGGNAVPQPNDELTAAIESQKKRVQDLMDDPNVTPEDMTDALRQLKNLQQEAVGGSNVPSQVTPPGQMSLTGEGQAAADQVVPTQGVTPQPLTPEQKAEFLKVTGQQPSFADALTTPGAEAPPLSSGQKVALAKIGREDLIPASTPMTEQERAALKLNRQQLRRFYENANIPETAPQTPRQAPLAPSGERLANVYKPTPQEIAAFNERVRIASESGDPAALSEAMNSSPALRQGGGAGGNPPPPKTPGQGMLGGGVEPIGNAGSLGREIIRSIADIPGEMIALKSSLTPPFLRQGKVRLVTSPVNAMKEFYTSLGAAFNDERALRIQQALKTDDWIRDSGPMRGYTYRDVGGTLLELGEQPEERQVGIAGGSWLRRKIRNNFLIKGSDQQAVVMLNLMRTNWYKEVAQQMWASGERDIKQYTRLREFIEHSTHRGAGGQIPFPLFFSVKAQTGRAQALADIGREAFWNGMRHTRIDPTTGEKVIGISVPGVQKQAAKATVAMVAANMAQMSAMSALGLGVIEYKDGLPTLRHGVQHFDPWAGWNQQAKLVMGVAKDITNTFGDVLNGEQGWEAIPDDFAPKIADRAMHFLRQGFSPFYGTATAVATGEDYKGQPYHLSNEIKSGRLLSDWTLPINIEEYATSFKEAGLVPTLVAALPVALSEGVSTYQSLTDMRNDAAKKAGVDSYNAAGPQLKFDIDQSPEIAKFREDNPSAYNLALKNQEETNRDIVGAKEAETRFESGTLDKPIREYWDKETTARGAIIGTLEAQFAKEFSNFDKTKFQTALDGFYKIDVKDPDGNHDFEGTEAARQRYAASLPPEQKQWIDEAVNVSREKKSPLHQEYLNTIDRKEAAGYFRDGITGAERAALDEQNPDLDFQSWKFGGGVKGSAGPALQTVEAVNQALAANLPNRPIKLTNTKRPINESPESQAAWEEFGDDLEFYQNSGTPEYRDAIAQKLFKSDFDELNADGQEKVTNRIKTNIRNNPRINAALVWWGATEKPSNEAKVALRRMIDQYGPLMEKEEK